MNLKRPFKSQGFDQHLAEVPSCIICQKAQLSYLLSPRRNIMIPTTALINSLPRNILGKKHTRAGRPKSRGGCISVRLPCRTVSEVKFPVSVQWIIAQLLLKLDI